MIHSIFFLGNYSRTKQPRVLEQEKADQVNMNATSSLIAETMWRDIESTRSGPSILFFSILFIHFKFFLLIDTFTFFMCISASRADID